jgi:hypothetical protein
VTITEGGRAVRVGDVVSGEAQVGERVHDGEVDRALDEERVGHDLEGKVGEELVALQQVLGMVGAGGQDMCLVDGLELLDRVRVLVRGCEIVGMHDGIHHDGSVNHLASKQLFV